MYGFREDKTRSRKVYRVKSGKPKFEALKSFATFAMILLRLASATGFVSVAIAYLEKLWLALHR